MLFSGDTYSVLVVSGQQKLNEAKMDMPKKSPGKAKEAEL